jgi:hypothetical protein
MIPVWVLVASILATAVIAPIAWWKLCKWFFGG